MKFLKIVFLLFLVTPAGAQKLGHAPYFSTHNPRKLSHQLTKGLTSDSLKVRSIYLWMTRHIAYDAKGFSVGPYPSFDPKVVLRRRKAVCLGYSTLFNALCKEAGIWAETVSGYDKGEGFEENDTLFTGHHAWSAVYLNESWRLLDITFASGYLGYKETFGSKLARLFIWHRAKHVKLGYVRKRDDFYYLTDPKLLAFDHLPEDPAWQLLPCTLPVDSFQTSDIAVCRALRKVPGKGCSTFLDSVTAIMNDADTMHRQLRAGMRAAAYNERNHALLAIGYNNYGNSFMKNATDEGRSNDDRLKLCRTSAAFYDSAYKYEQVASAEINLELAVKMRRYEGQRKKANAFYKGLIARDRLINKKMTLIAKSEKTDQRLRKANDKQFIADDKLAMSVAVATPRTNLPKDSLSLVIEQLLNTGDSLKAIDSVADMRSLQEIHRWADSMNVHIAWLVRPVFPVRDRHPQLNRIDSLARSDEEIFNDHLERFTRALENYTAAGDVLFRQRPQQQARLTYQLAQLLIAKMKLDPKTSEVPALRKAYADLENAMNRRQQMRTDETPRFRLVSRYIAFAPKAEGKLMHLKNSELNEKEKMARHLHDTFSKNMRDNMRGTKSNQANAKKIEKLLLAKMKKEKSAS